MTVCNIFLLSASVLAETVNRLSQQMFYYNNHLGPQQGQHWLTLFFIIKIIPITL